MLCQKPLAPSFAEASALVAQVGDRCRLMVHENWRFRRYYRDLARLLREGRIGEVMQGQMVLLSSGLLPDERGRLPLIERQPFIATLERALVMEVLIHHIDTLRFLLGEMTLSYACLGRALSAIRGEERAFMAFETAAGAPIALLSNLAVHGQPPGLTDRLTLIGTHGTAVLDGNALRFVGKDACELTYDMAACYLQSYADAIGHFVELSAHRRTVRNVSRRQPAHARAGRGGLSTGEGDRKCAT